MQRKRGEVVPIGEVVSGLDDALVPAIRETQPPARRGFTVADQVNQLVSASEADPDRGFMGRTMALCSLPRTNPGNRKEYIRRNGPFTLAMTARGQQQAPLRQLSPPDPGLGVLRSRKDPKPCADPGGLPSGFHEDSGSLQQRRAGASTPSSATRCGGSSTHMCS